MPHGDDYTWIQTASGKQFYPLDPHPEDVCIEDIAHALALVNRYNGHTRVPYSVTEHSVRVEQWIHDTTFDLASKRLYLTALLHDASEAYICDLARPLKQSMTEYVAIEERLERCIAERFNLIYPYPSIVKMADNILLVTERRDLMATPPRPWKQAEGVEPLSEKIVPWTWQEAEKKFLERFHELTET